MDERLEKALDFANYRATIANQKRNLHNRIATVKVVHFEGAQFTASKENIAFVNAMIDMGYETNVVVEDDKNNPVEIANLKQLLEALTSAYAGAMNEFLIENKKINKARSLKTLMDW